MERATRFATTNINDTNNLQNKKQRIHFQCWIYLCLAVLLCTIEQMCSPLVVALSVSNASMTKCLFGYFPPSSLVSSANIDFYLLSSPLGCSMPSNIVSHALHSVHIKFSLWPSSLLPCHICHFPPSTYTSAQPIILLCNLTSHVQAPTHKTAQVLISCYYKGILFYPIMWNFC